jgi:hypothetical protein
MLSVDQSSNGDSVATAGIDDVNNNNNNSQEDMRAIELTVGIGVLKFITTCIVILFVEKGGRRAWLLSGMTCISVSLAFLCIAFVGRNGEGGDVESSENIQNDFGIVGIYGVAVGYAASFGPLTWLITSELFPSSIRGRSLGFATIVTYIAAGLVSRTFLSLQQGIGLSACFALYLISTMISIVLVWLGLPDTGGEKTPGEIRCELDEMWLWGGRRRHDRCIPYFSWKNRSPSEERLSTTSSWTSLRNYGSWTLSPDPSLDADDACPPSTPPDHPGLIRRSSSSKNIKEII